MSQIFLQMCAISARRKGSKQKEKLLIAIHNVDPESSSIYIRYKKSQNTKIAETYEKLAVKLFRIMPSEYERVDTVADSSIENSITEAEHAKR